MLDNLELLGFSSLFMFSFLFSKQNPLFLLYEKKEEKSLLVLKEGFIFKFVSFSFRDTFVFNLIKFTELADFLYNHLLFTVFFQLNQYLCFFLHFWMKEYSQRLMPHSSFFCILFQDLCLIIYFLLKFVLNYLMVNHLLVKLY